MKKAYFISDLHLGATYNKDDRKIEKSVVAFLDSIKPHASEIFLLGDILDYWYEYKYVVPKGFVRFFGKLAELSDAGVRITWIIGNHDIWIFDYIPQELGIEVIDGIVERDILGTRFSLQHGDAIGGSKTFRFIRAMFRNKVCQFFYSGIHPRWTIGFANAWSKKSRTDRKKNNIPESLIVSIRQWCVDRIMHGDKAEFFVFGHLHGYYNEKLPENRCLIVIPDWATSPVFGVFDGSSFEIKNYIDMHL